MYGAYNCEISQTKKEKKKKKKIRDKQNNWYVDGELTVTGYSMSIWNCCCGFNCLGVAFIGCNGFDIPFIGDSIRTVKPKVDKW